MPSKRKWAAPDEDMVLFYPAVLRAYLDEGELAVTMLADDIGRSHQAVSKLLHGDEPKRARRKLLVDVVKRLGIDIEDATTRAPELVAKIFGHKRGFETQYSVRTALRVKRVLDHVKRATERDVHWWLDNGYGGEPQFDECAVSYVVAGFARTFTVSFLRERLLRAITPESLMLQRRSPAKEPMLTLAGEPVDDPQHEKAVLARIASIEYAIGPWLLGDDGTHRMHMDYPALYAFAIPERREHRVGFVENWRDFDGLILPVFDGEKAPPGRARAHHDPYTILHLAAGDPVEGPHGPSA